jgi:DNA repair exonuclease SbcCD ATPase subunit
LQNTVSTGALKLEILDKKDRQIKIKEKEIKETNNKLRNKIEEYNEKNNELQKLLEEVKKFLSDANHVDNAD